MAKNKVKILVVDDLSEKLLVYHTVLDELEEELYTASSGEEALKLILKHDFAVILLDVNMPGMDGLETATFIRNRLKSRFTPIIFVTAFLDEFRSQQGYAHGAVDYILAPIDPVILRAKVKVFVDLYRMRNEVEHRANERVLLAEERAKRLMAEEAHRVSSFLSQASMILTQSLDLPDLLSQLAGLSVPVLAEGCLVSVTIPGEGELLHRSAWLHPDMASHQQDIIRHLDSSIHACIESGHSQAIDDTHAIDWPDECGLHVKKVLILPLRARGTVLGTMVFINPAPPGQHTLDIQTIKEELTSRAAIAIHNALLIQHIREVDHRKDEFLAILAHELRNPLAPIRNALSILQMKEHLNASVQSATSMISRQVSQLTHLVNDLLDVSRISSGKIRLSLDCVDILSCATTAIDANKHLLEAKDQRLVLDVPDAPLYMNGDAVRLTQIISNLLNNAGKYTGNQGTISLTIARVENRIQIAVCDSGEGIPPQMLQRIFDLFTQVDESYEKSQGGLGIGLSIVKTLVDLHDGEIEVESTEEKGSTFTVTFPFNAALQKTVPVDGSSTTSFESCSLTVLVVDDNIDAADSMAMLLELMKVNVLTANNGEEAILKAEEHRPSIIFLDIGMPGMNGFEVAKNIREKQWAKATKIIAMTGWGQEDARQLSSTSGIDVHLVKPVNFDQVRELVNS